jgi:hypothetical protein
MFHLRDDSCETTSVSPLSRRHMLFGSKDSISNIRMRVAVPITVQSMQGNCLNAAGRLGLRETALSIFKICI